MSKMPTSLASMTGFGHSAGMIGDMTWSWELRSVNGRGLELRFRLPPGYDAQEPALREVAGRVLRRGNVTANLSIRRERAIQMVADPSALDQILDLVATLALRLPSSPPPRIEALLALPGVLRVANAAESEPEPAAAAEAILAGFATALAELTAGRRSEGARLATLLAGQISELSALHDQASREAADQPAQQRARLMETVQTLLRDAMAVSEERIAQEVAVLASRSDVREELDRLASHIDAARALLAEGVLIGRRFDFLVQEFNREANTLCSKSASIALTATGLGIKTLIEQLREQVQNIE
jgi:uncharacterized protein (TIGR00255 family)